MNRSLFPVLTAGLSRLQRHRGSPDRGADQRCALTERRQTDRRHHPFDCRQREFRLGAAVQAGGTGIYDLDFATGSNYWSAELKALAGLPGEPGDVPLEQWVQLMHPDDRDRVMLKLQDSLDPEGDGWLDEEYRLVRPDGTLCWLKVRGQTFFAATEHGRRILGASGIVVDITDRREAEKRLREQSEELRLALRVGNSGTFQWDARTHEHRWCDEMLALYGLEREEFGGRDQDWLDCLLPEDREATMAAVERSLQTGEYNTTFRIRRRNDGEIRWVNGRGQVFFDGDGTPTRMVGINVDISAQKRIEARLQESETRLMAVLESLSEGVVVFDLDGQVLNTNAAAWRILGHGPRDGHQGLPDCGESFDLLSMAGGMLPREEWPIRRVLRGDSFSDCEILLRRKDDGSRRVISHNGTPVRNGGSTILGVLTLRDVTESKAAARALKESEHRLAVALQASGSAVWEMDVADGILRGEPLLFTMLGYAPGELTTLAEWHAQIHPEDREGISGQLEEMMVGKRDFCRFEVRVRAKDGTWRWILSQAAPAERDAEGRAVRLVGTHTDIQERKETEEAVRRDGSRLRSILDNAPVLIWIREREGRVALANRSLLETVDLPPAERFIGQSIFQLFPKGMAERIWARDQQALETQVPLQAEETLLHRDGSEHAYLTITFPVLDVQTGHPRSVCSISMEITDRKAMEMQIQALNADLERRVQERTAQLQRANESLLQTNMDLRHFAHATAHDLQTPLRSIAGFAQLLRREVQDHGNERVEEWSALVVENTKRLQRLIQELLSYTRLDVQGLPFEAVNLRQVVDEVLSSLSVLIGETGAVVSRGDDLPTLMADRIQIAQIMQNLIENGIKYNRSKPPRVAVCAELVADEWVFSVSDNGIGIDPKHQEKIFEIFRRLHAYHQIPGSGIGLALCRRILERHGGHIWVASEPGKGSTFYFSLPAGGEGPR